MKIQKIAMAGIIFSCLMGNWVLPTVSYGGKEEVEEISILSEKGQKKLRENLLKKWEDYEKNYFYKNYEEWYPEENQKIIDSGFPFLEEIKKLKEGSNILDFSVWHWYTFKRAFTKI
jgi:hypothetical protein